MPIRVVIRMSLGLPQDMYSHLVGEPYHGAGRRKTV